MTRVLFLADSMDSPSGFGCVIRNIIDNFCSGKIENDLEIGHLSWQYTGQRRERWEKHWKKSIMEYPIHSHRFGKDSFTAAIKNFKPDIVWSLGDFWMINWLGTHNYQRLLKEMNAKWYWYAPVDSEVIPYNFKNLLNFPDKIICMSQSGSDTLKRERPDLPHWMIPHGVNTEIYKPLSEEERDELRLKGGYKDKFVIGAVGRNQPRKSHDLLAIAFANFAKDKKDVMLHFHGDPIDPANMTSGFDGDRYPYLMTVIQMLKHEHDIVFTRGITYNDGLSLEMMNKLYNMFHIHSLATTGEGFGLPTLESNSCGVPNVITDYTSSRELVEGHGELVKVKMIVPGSFGTYRALIDIEDMTQKFQKMYDDWKDGGKLRKEYGRKAREHALGYDWTKKIVPQWNEILSDAK
jgi:glycosyltransferase involved in cell wall biosynthesis